MRSILVALMMLGAGVSSPAWSQSWSGSLPAVQGQERTLTFEVNLEALLSWNLYLAYSPNVFSSPVFSFDVPFDYADVGPPGAPLPEHFPTPVPAGFVEIVVSAFGALPMDVNGTLFSTTFSVPIAGGTGPTEVFSRFIYGLDSGFEDTIDLPVLSTNIAAIPEPETWAMMLAGLGLVGFCAARRRKTRA